MFKIVSRLFLLNLILFIFSCAAPRVEVPVYESADVRDILSARSGISAIDADFSITFEKDDAEMKGDGVLNILKNGDLNLRVYSFGFLAFELISEKGVVNSKPPIDRRKSTILTQGLRDCLFWWDMKDFELIENSDSFLLENFSRKLWVDRKTMLPLRQTVSLEDGLKLDIHYDNPEKSQDIWWYPSKIRIELSHYAVTLRIRNIAFAS